MSPMEITITSITMLKPAAPHPLAGEMVPLTAFDRATFDIFVPMVFAYDGPAPSNDAIKHGLAMAIAAFPHTAGRLTLVAAAAANHRRRRHLHVSNDGVLVVEATVADADMADVLAATGAAAATAGLYPAPPEDCIGAPLLQVKLTRFRCGGLVVGLIAHHHLGDGHSMNAFSTTWARAVRDGGEKFAAPSPPFLDRAVVTAAPRRPPAPVFDHRSIEFEVAGKRRVAHAGAMDKITNLAVHFTAEFIADLKSRVAGGGDAIGRCSTFECVLAHAWKKITAARGVTPEEHTRVRVAVDCRSRSNPPAPASLIGNMVLWAFPRMQVRRLLASSYGGVVGAIRAAVSRVDAEYIQSFVDFAATADATGGEEELAATAPVVGETLCPNLEVDSWLGFRFHEMDLGTGPPVAVLTPDLPVEGLMVLVPASGGGVDLFVALTEDHAKVFERICYSLEEHPMILSHL